jgi:MSHA pilin protein MshA
MRSLAHKKEAGFTFIEIIVVIVVIGILAAIAVPKFIDLTGDAKVAAADGTFGAMQSATALAFANHRAGKLTESGTGDDQFITDPASLVHYLDGGVPEGVTVDKTKITLQDGSEVTIEAETDKNKAQLTRTKK